MVLSVLNLQESYAKSLLTTGPRWPRRRPAATCCVATSC